jgi:hypothetical protein
LFYESVITGQKMIGLAFNCTRQMNGIFGTKAAAVLKMTSNDINRIPQMFQTKTPFKPPAPKPFFLDIINTTAT